MKTNILGADAIEWLGVHYKTILKTTDAGGAMSVVDSVSPPESGPPRHIHHDADETFVVLTGDACYFRETLDTGRLPVFANDADEQRRSLARLRDLERSGARLVFGHDPGQVPDDEVRTA